MKEFVIETRKLTKCYGEQTVVKEVDLHVRKGEIYGLLGRNGAGKTTLMKMILGLTPETSGEVELFGRKLRGQEKLDLSADWRDDRGAGILPESDRGQKILRFLQD